MHFVESIHLLQFSEHLLPNSGEAKKPIYFNVNNINIINNLSIYLKNEIWKAIYFL